MSRYGELLKSRGVTRVLASQLLARFPAGMLSLAYLLHVEHQTSSYAVAGIVLAAECIAQAFSGPMTSRLLSRLGVRPVILTMTLICAASITAIAVIPPVPALYVLIGAITGASMPPIMSAVRTIYPQLVNGQKLTLLFSLDAAANEIIWVVGPVLTTLISTQIGTLWGVLAAAFMTVAGGIWFFTIPEFGALKIPRPKRHFGAVLSHPSVVLMVVVGFLLVAAAASVEVAVVALFGHGNILAGLSIAIFAIGSLIGGVAGGHIGVGPWSTARRMMIVAVGIAATVLFPNFWWLAACLFVAGIGFAPAVAAMNSVVSSSVRMSDSPEAFGWLGTGQLVGAALGAATAGISVDSFGTGGAFYIAGIFAALGAIVPAFGRRWNPDLRGKHITPLPETGVISTHPVI